jgi:hypothetical protein
MLSPRFFFQSPDAHVFERLPVGDCYFSIHNSISKGRAECRHEHGLTLLPALTASAGARILGWLKLKIHFPPSFGHSSDALFVLFVLFWVEGDDFSPFSFNHLRT